MDMDNYRTKLKKLCIGEKIADIPIIQGGMGVGISRSGLARSSGKGRRSRSDFNCPDRL